MFMLGFLGWHPIRDMINAIRDFLVEAFRDGTALCIDMMNNLFERSVENVRVNVAETPTEFSQTITENLRLVSNTAILPVAGLILTYIFCHEVYIMVTEKNKGGEFEIGQLLFLIIKTSVMITFLVNCYDICLAVFDLSKWITDQVPSSVLELPDKIKDEIINDINNRWNLGYTITMWLMSGVALIITFVMTGIIYLVAWSRIVTIFIYISVAPIPFVTFLNKEWIGSIGQTYVKNLLALMLQGYLMLVCLIIYAGLLEKAADLIANGGSALYGILLLLVSMCIIVVSLTRTHGLAKSIVGVG